MHLINCVIARDDVISCIIMHMCVTVCLSLHTKKVISHEALLMVYCNQ